MSNKKKLWFNWLNSGGGASSSYDPDYQAVLDRATALGAGYEHPSDPVKTAQNALMILLKAGSIDYKTYWDILRVHAHDGGIYFSMINWVNPSTFLATMPAGDLVHTTNVGFTAGNGAKYIDQNYNPTNDGTKFTLNNASALYYKAGAQSINTTFGIHSADNKLNIQPARSIGLAYNTINGASLSGSTPGAQIGVGLYTVTYNGGDISGWFDIWSGETRKIHGNIATTTGLVNANIRSAWYGDDKNSFEAYGADCRAIVPAVSQAIEAYLAELFFLTEGRAYWDFQ